MIITVTVNPALDLTLVCDEPVTDGTVRPRGELRHAGGKGIDVSRVIRNLGGETIATGFLGGFTGKYMEGRLLQEGLEIDFVEIVQETRTNVIINAPDSNDSPKVLNYRYNAPGPEVHPTEYLDLIRKVRELRQADKLKWPKYAAVCGSLSGKTMEAGAYATLIREFKALGAVTALDSSGKAMQESMKRIPRPDIIKPNIVEFNELIGDRLIPEKMSKPKERWLREQCQSSCGGNQASGMGPFWYSLLQAVHSFRKEYPDIVATILSLGSRGILLVHQDSILHAFLRSPLPPEKTAFPVGAGDAALGAILFALDDRNGDWDYALRLGVAAGAAAVGKPGTEAPSREEVMELLPNVDSHDHSLPTAIRQPQPSGQEETSQKKASWH